MNKLWDNINRGVRSFPPDPATHMRHPLTRQRQWKDIRAKYIEGGDEDDE